MRSVSKPSYTVLTQGENTHSLTEQLGPSTTLADPSSAAVSIITNSSV